MVKGQLKLARRATPGLTLNVKAVYRDDDFDHDEGTQPRLYHKPNPTGARADTDIIAVYARALFPGASAWEFEVLYKSDIDRYRAYSRAKGEGSPWAKFYGEQAKKTVMKQLLKRLPEAVGAPPDVPDALDGMDLEDDVAGIINAEQGSYTVRDVDASTGEITPTEPVQSTRGPLETDQVPVPRQRKPRAQQPPPTAEVITTTKRMIPPQC